MPDPVPEDVDPFAVRDLKNLAGMKSVPEFIERLRLLVEHLELSTRSPVDASRAARRRPSRRPASPRCCR